MPVRIARRARWLTAAVLLCAAGRARAAPELLYVAVGGSAELTGAARTGDPARIAGRLEAGGRRVRLVDLTAPGAGASAVRAEQLLRAVALRPALVTVALGPVDVMAKASLKGFSRDLEIVADLLRRNAGTVVVATLPHAEVLRPGADRAFRRRVDAFNWAIVRIARRHGLTLVDLRREPGASAASWEEAAAPVVERALPPPRSRGQALREATSAADPRRAGGAGGRPLADPPG
jgi:hypothetical protein